jgi:hypothetical protein
LVSGQPAAAIATAATASWFVIAPPELEPNTVVIAIVCGRADASRVFRIVVAVVVV